MKVSIKLSILVVACFSLGLLVLAGVQNPPTEGITNRASATPAAAGFEEKTNGFLSQELYDEAKEVFEEIETAEDGMGPVFNATACGDCHQTPVAGGSSQITELRAGRWNGSQFQEQVGGSLINDRALDPLVQEVVLEDSNVRTFRSSLSTLGDGFVEAIADSTLIAISNGQPASMRGQIIRVPVAEANGALRVARFGWKNQHASLESFAADAYLNEMGITSPLQPTENSSNGNSVKDYDHVNDPEDDGADVRLFAQFMRSTTVPPRDEAIARTADAQAGSELFNRIGCDTCHVRRIETAAPGTSINGGAFVIPDALGNKLIAPFGDFLLHDIGTGDGIVQNGGPSTMNKVRTAPLWGMRTRTRFMHDGESVSPNEAILRHRGEAGFVTFRYRLLSPADRQNLLTFLRSL